MQNETKPLRAKPRPTQARTFHDMNWNAFARWERSTRDVIDVKRCYVDVAGDIVAGVMLSQIVYWHLPDHDGHSRLTVEREGRLWLVKKREDWWAECRVSVWQADRALTALEQKGLIETNVWKFHGSPCKHIALDTNALLDALREVI